MIYIEQENLRNEFLRPFVRLVVWSEFSSLLVTFFSATANTHPCPEFICMYANSGNRR